MYSSVHKGKPSFGRDHVSSTCTAEGRTFADGAAWWEPAVVVLDVAPPAPAAVPA